jgi:hypothetical protein
VSIDDIVERIGGQADPLRAFRRKAGLFEIVISEYCAGVQRVVAAVDQKAGLEKQLTAIGRHFQPDPASLNPRAASLDGVDGPQLPVGRQLLFQLGPISAYGLGRD